MGILDDLLGGLATQSMSGGAPRQGPQAGTGGADMSGVLAALMPVVLSMLSNRGSQAGGPGPAGLGGAGGGLGDVLGQVLGGATGGRGAAGGLGGLLEQARRAGFGEQVDSWVSPGANKPISPDAMAQIFGDDEIEQISRRAGISREQAAQGLSRILPEIVDRVTPDGNVSDFSALTKSVDDLARRFGAR
jgi:uncharacterized protein YidB (DUF937 family)